MAKHKQSIFKGFIEAPHSSTIDPPTGYTHQRSVIYGTCTTSEPCCYIGQVNLRWPHYRLVCITEYCCD